MTLERSLTDAEVAERVIVTLLGCATAAEHPKVISAAVRAGLMWNCEECRGGNYPTRKVCDHCRAPHPSTKADA